MLIKLLFLIFLAAAGLIDSIYLTWEHFNKVIPPCTINPLIPAFLIDCGKVLTSPYSIIFGVPLALIGAFHYGLLSLLIVLALKTQTKLFRYWIILQSAFGALFSFYLMYIQLTIIKSICIYCTLSALISFILFILTYYFLKKERFELHTAAYAFVYQNFIKRVFFLLDAEFIHSVMVKRGKFLATTPLIRLVGSKLIYKDKSLRQKVSGINFENPIGLAAGFDYNADLTQALYYLDFGFQSVGTITNYPYEGNPYPRLGRLPKSKSLMVNKGFRNKGAKTIAKHLKNLNFKIPVGISVGMSNSENLTIVPDAIKDIIAALKTFEKSGVKNSYYELNVSCPNLIHAKQISFYLPKNFRLLLSAIDRLRLKKPVFVKMPIDKTNAQVSAMLGEIVKHKSVKGAIFGNLQKDRKNPAIVPAEVKKFKVGNFSGKPCEERSNELIRLAYKKYGDKLIIIGCGGVFSGKDAYKKIKLGASLVQLITGMIFQGPQLISQINLELIDLLKKDGFKNITQAIGYENR